MNLKTKRNKRSLFGKQVGASLPDQLVLWLCNTVTIKVLFFHQESPRFKLLLFQSHSKEKSKLLMKLVKNCKQLLNNQISEFTMITEIITIQDGNITIGNLKVSQLELKLVQKILKRIKLNVFLDTMDKNSNFLKTELFKLYLKLFKKFNKICIKMHWTDLMKEEKMQQLGKNSWLN